MTGRATRGSLKRAGISLTQYNNIVRNVRPRIDRPVFGPHMRFGPENNPNRRQQPALPGAQRRAFVAQYRIPPDHSHRHRLPDAQGKTVAVRTHRRRLPA